MKKNYHFYAITTIIFWALAFVFTRLALQYFDVYTLSFLRYLAASITLLIIICFIKINKPKKKDLPTFILSGALGFFIYIILFNKGTALEKLVHYLGFDMSEGIAFGDQFNDIEMLQMAGDSYALSGCAPGVETYANHMTDSVQEVLKKVLAEL